MSSDDGGLPLAPTVGDVGAEAVEAFGVLGNEIRLATLLALWDAEEPWQREGGLAFSELYDRLEIGDSGQFNYHLDKLVPRFVTDDGDTYALTSTGFRLVQAVVAGTAASDPEVAETQVDRACPFCGEAAHLRYRHGVTQVYCTNCPGYGTVEADDGEHGILLRETFPSAGVADRSPEEVVDATVVRFLGRFESMLAGVCADCGGTVVTTLDVCEDHTAADGRCRNCGRATAGWLQCTCETCTRGSGGPAWLALEGHPTVEAFLHEHGLDHGGDPWRRKELGAELGYEETMMATAPPRIRIDIECDEERLQATVEEDGSVLDVSRETTR